MILPRGYRKDMTDDEVVEAYMSMGKSEQQARAKLWALRYNTGKPLR
ncbi:MAG: hypothetical protein ACT4QF_00265 [Sporichthyaceae bacterium]